MPVARTRLLSLSDARAGPAAEATEVSIAQKYADTTTGVDFTSVAIKSGGT